MCLVTICFLIPIKLFWVRSEYVPVHSLRTVLSVWCHGSAGWDMQRSFLVFLVMAKFSWILTWLSEDIAVVFQSRNSVVYKTMVLTVDRDVKRNGALGRRRLSSLWSEVQLSFTPELHLTVTSVQPDADGGRHVHWCPDHTALLVVLWAAGHLQCTCWSKEGKETSENWRKKTK